MNKEVFVQFDADAYKEYTELQISVAAGKHSSTHPTNEQLLTSINNAIRNVKANPFYGDFIPRKYVSKATMNRYGTEKIFRVELVGYWRLLYTIIGNEAKIVAFILEYMNHDCYNKIFGYRKK